MSIRTVLGASSLAIAAVAASASAAGAAEASTPDTLAEGHCTTLTGAKGCFIPDGDHVLVYDTASDGWRPSVQWRTNYGRKGECTWTGSSSPKRCNYDLLEDGLIEFRLIRRSDNRFEATGWIEMRINY